MEIIKKEQVRTSALSTLLEPRIYVRLGKETYNIYENTPLNLLSYKRFDIAFKVTFLDMINKNYRFGKSIYTMHIKAFSFGNYKEPENEKKVTIEKFIEIFHEIHKSILREGFDYKKTVIPLSKEGVILNGAHRFASALVCSKNIFYIKTEEISPVYDYSFFYKRNVPEHILDIVASKYVEITSNIQMALIWPSAVGNDEEIEQILGRIIYKKSIDLNLNGAHNLISQVYSGEKWLGSVENDYNGTAPKIAGCFKNKGPLRIVLFESTSLNDVTIAKEKIRALFNIGKHSIHITDRHDEVLKLSKILFNDNSIHFINNAKPNTFLAFHKQLSLFSEFVKKNKINPDDILIDSGMVLTLYGIRKCEDIDYILANKVEIYFKEDNINNHDSELSYHEKSKEDLIYDPSNFLYFADFKFVSFRQVYSFKKNRGSEKDLIDLSIMDAISLNDDQKLSLARCRQNIFYVKQKIKYFPIIISIRIFKKVGIYDKMRKIYHSFKKEGN